VINNLKITLFNKTLHNAKSFNCGNDALNQFIHQYAIQQQKKRVGRTFVAINEDNEVLGFHTLSAGSVRYEDAPMSLVQGLPKYPIPTTILGRLAVHKSQQGKGLGGLLLKDALLRVLEASQNLGIVAILVDAKNEKAANFYKHYGFIAFENRPYTLFMHLETIATAYYQNISSSSHQKDYKSLYAASSSGNSHSDKVLDKA
jgi:GNAT superfamily N-acetyltransferase